MALFARGREVLALARFERFPAFQQFQQFCFDLRQPCDNVDGWRRLSGVGRRVFEFLGERSLLGFQCSDTIRQTFKFTLLFPR